MNKSQLNEFSSVVQSTREKIKKGEVDFNLIMDAINYHQDGSFGKIYQPKQSRVSWRTFYFEVFGLELDTKRLRIPRPDKEKDLTFLIAVAKGITPNLVISKYPIYNMKPPNFRGDMDNFLIGFEDRDSHKKSYGIRVRPRKCADREFRGLSLKEIRDADIKSMTLTEMLLLKLYLVWLEVGRVYSFREQRIDEVTATLCGGSHPYKSPTENDYLNVVTYDNDRKGIAVTWTNDSKTEESFRIREVLE